MTVPVATYRLQINRDFPWTAAGEIVPYLAELGIGAAYVSPVLTARPGSAHGYDVVDPGELNPELGGEDGMAGLSDRLRAHGLGLIVDVVPNHMCIAGSANRYWNDLLEHGPSSPFAHWFDIDWTPPKPDLEAKVLLAVLGDQFGRILEAGQIRVVYEEGAFTLHYHDLRFPVAPKTWPRVLHSAVGRLRGVLPEHVLELESIITALEHLPPRTETDRRRVRERLRDREILRRRVDERVRGDTRVRTAIDEALSELNGKVGQPNSFDGLEALLSEQGYRLSDWRVAAEEINYRRFFDINELAAVRVEEPSVFEAVHEVLLRLVRGGQVTGVRVDHVDGLWDPEAYVARLQRALRSAAGGEGGQYVVVEKILEPGERLPEQWQVAGTTGYDFLNLVGGFFVAGDGMPALLRLEAELAAESRRFADVAYEAKKLVLRVALSAELTVLARRLDRLSEQHRSSRDFTLQSQQEALAEIIACFPVYRTYVREGDAVIRPEDRVHVETAVRAAKRRNPATSPSIFDFLRGLLLLEDPPGLDRREAAERRDFVLRLQQLTAPVMAKGLEDTAFYRYFPLASLNEVGGPTSLRGISVDELHRENAERLRRMPHTMSATATHDTKRGEDVRSRLHALSEIPEEWTAAVHRWREFNRGLKQEVGDDPAPDDLTEYLLYQTIIGVWPADGVIGEAGLVARVQAYMTKALREAKLRTSWINPDEEYEAAIGEFVAAVLDPVRSSAFLADVARFHARVAPLGVCTSLSQVVLKLASPGVPDFYQGTELWDLALVDPDNRRPVDFAARRALLAELRRDAAVDAAALTDRLFRAPADGRIKLFVTHRALELRQTRREVFDGGAYVPLTAVGAQAAHLAAFARGEGARPVIVLAARWFAALRGDGGSPLGEAAWGDTHVSLAPLFADGAQAAQLQDAITGRRIAVALRAGQPVLPLAEAFAHLPVALLEVVG